MAGKKKTSVANVQSAAAADSGDIDVPVKPGTGKVPSIYFMLEAADDMGWTVTHEEGKGTTVWIPDDAPWQIAEDFATEAVYLEVENKVLKQMNVEGLMDEDGNDAPPVQMPKKGFDFKTTLRIGPPPPKP